MRRLLLLLLDEVVGEEEELPHIIFVVVPPSATEPADDADAAALRFLPGIEIREGAEEGLSITFNYCIICSKQGKATTYDYEPQCRRRRSSKSKS